MATIIESVKELEKKIDKIDPIKVKKQAEKKVRRERIIESARGMSLAEKIELIMKIL